MAGSVLSHINARGVPCRLFRLNKDRGGGAAGLVNDLDFGRKGIDHRVGVVDCSRSGKKQGKRK